MIVVSTANKFLSSMSDQYERPLFLVARKSFVSTTITLMYITARVLSPPCHEESFRLQRCNVLDGASYAVTELCVHRRPLIDASCKCLLFSEYFGQSVVSRLARCCSVKGADIQD